MRTGREGAGTVLAGVPGEEGSKGWVTGGREGVAAVGEGLTTERE